LTGTFSNNLDLTLTKQNPNTAFIICKHGWN